MTQTNDPAGSNAPGFGAFIGSDANDNSRATSKAVSARRSTKTDSSDRSTKTGPAEQSTKKAPTRRGGRRKKKPSGSTADRESEASAATPVPVHEDGTASPRRSRMRKSAGPARSRRAPAGTADDSNLDRGASDNQPAPAELDSSARDNPAGAEGNDGDRDKPRRKRTRGGRGRSRKKTTGDGDGNEIADLKAEGRGDAEPQETKAEREGPGRRTKSRRRTRGGRGRSVDPVESDASHETDSAAQGENEADDSKRRRRGSRGGRSKSKKLVGSRDKPGAAVVEFIPGEEDDLPALPELPDEAELMNGSDLDGDNSRERKRSRRKRGSDSEEGEDLRPARKKVEVVPDRKILVNACDSEETRVAVVRDGVIMDFQMNVESDTSLVNDIYRGRIVNIEASIGAAFVDFGRGRNGFLHTSDVLPTYADKSVSLSQLLSTSVDPEDWDEDSSQPALGAAMAGSDDHDDDGDGEAADGDSKGKGTKGGRRSSKKKAKGRQEKPRQKRFRTRPRRPINELFKVGQKVVVQITKDAIGDKGPTLTTYLSIPGRYLVLMPSISHRGVSRKIEDSKERKRLKRILDAMTVPDGMGVIARTATQGHTKAEIKRDLDYLLSAWKKLAKGLEHGHGPATLYQESDAAIRTVRDLFGPETESVIVDDPEAYKNIREFAELLMPEQAHRIVEHEGKRPLFHTEGVEQDFEKIFARRIELPSGGSVVFDQAEALVAIDVNSGKTRTSSHDFEEIALKTNMEAVPEIARQIRLRDLGGIIVCDFIDMMKNSNRRMVEQTFRAQFSTDRARSKMGRISQFGLLEMTRQRLGPGMSKKLFKPCVTCRGAGLQRTDSSKAAAILRRLGSALTLKGFTKVEVRAHPGTIDFLKKVRSSELAALEETSGRTLELKAVADQTEDSVLRYLRTDGREVRPGGRRKR